VGLWRGLIFGFPSRSFKGPKSNRRSFGSLRSLRMTGFLGALLMNGADGGSWLPTHR